MTTRYRSQVLFFHRAKFTAINFISVIQLTINIMLVLIFGWLIDNESHAKKYPSRMAMCALPDFNFS
jgi:hypothetical protein